ncbi:hypothetical protein D0Z07_4573 [Hyphodiscus hymeniophilus]|uniref:Phosphoglycerate mutase n=1 Tax=Hyphodiscus hymeniophilus TaxID=353542 RepID=A0A9P6VKT7_9HELO|nr:hypothetical protein D0Z07_4573 [Hyphodiscus hymeniophilus]
MGWSPAVVIVVRHGARLDAADKHWHLTSPTPYDPPLTYGGWNQSKQLGARIANILRTRETDDEIPVTNGEEGQDGGNNRKRRHRVIIHSSPFLRCVQTSVAISAGLAQNPGHTPRPSSSKTSMHSSPKIRSQNLTNSPKLEPISGPAKGKVVGDAPKEADNIKKSAIRVDAFLGEWLSPEYFEHITPPPSSIMMVTGAKSELLQREDYSKLQIYTKVPPVTQGFPGGWGSPIVLPQKGEDDDVLSSMSSLAQALPRRDRTSSLSSMGSNGSRARPRSPNPPAVFAPTAHGVYQPPIPTHAISNSSPIPPGYFAHARDACVDADYQWDSMREPQMWGNGGEYGEEWSSMHKRFRNGLKQMVNWYNTNDDPGKLVTKTPTTPQSPHSPMSNTLDETDDEDEDTDLVLILVTHGAGCNALIGALTNQPVLLDVGMASLTMAVRKPTPVNTPTSTPGHSRNSSRHILISDQYDVKLVANTEHLRSSASSTPSSSRTPSVSGLTKFREPIRNEGAFDRPVRSFTASGNFGSIRRTASIATAGVGASGKSYVPIRQSSMGLWSPTPPKGEESEEADDEMILNFGNENEGPLGSALQPDGNDDAVVPDERENHENDDVAPLGGLWGGPRPPGQAEQNRETGQKRRWTVHERLLHE